MKLIFKSLILCFLFTSNIAFAQESTTFIGKVTDSENVPLVGVNVILKGTFTGSTTNLNGEYAIRINHSDLPNFITFSYIGYETQEILVTKSSKEINVKLEKQNIQVKEFIVAASRVEEKILEAPVTVERISATQIENSGHYELFNGLAQRKGVDISTSSMLISSISTRGFNSPRSDRVIQLYDYVDTQSPSLSFNFGNALGLPEIDIQSVDIIHGPASALYGANAFNGVILTNSKDPFLNEGLDIWVRGGTREYFDGQFRYAQKVNNFLAWKVTGSYLTGNDFIANDNSAMSLVTDPNNNPEGSTLGYNAVNRYGDVSTLLDLDFNGSPETRVFMPGWSEQDIISDDNKTKLLRIHPSVSYLLTNKIKLTGDFRYVNGTTTAQSNSRYRVRDFWMRQGRVEINGGNWFVRGFHTRDNGGDSYDMNFTGIFMNTKQVDGLVALKGTPLATPVSSYGELYFVEYQGNYANALFGGASPEEAQVIAQNAANATVLNPNSPEFKEIRSQVIASAKPGFGSRVQGSSAISDISGQYDYNNKIADLNIGGSYRRFAMSSEGVLFRDTLGEDIINYEFGAYLQAKRNFAKDRIKLAGAVRFDAFQNFDPAISPRFSAVLSLDKKKLHNFRASFGSAFRSPSQLDQYLLLDIGAVYLLGNISNGFKGYRTSILTSESVTAILTAAAMGQEPDVSAHQFEAKPLQTEQIQTLEIGYKGLIKDKLLIDMNYYSSTYNNFIGAAILVGNIDGSSPDPVALAQVLAGIDTTQVFNQAGNETRVIQAYHNLDQEVKAQGFQIGLEYYLNKAINLRFNYSFNELINRDDLPDNFLTFYNTPKNKFNVGSSGKIANRIRYNINYRWVEGFLFEFPVATGTIEDYSTLDASISYEVPRINSTFRLNATNILDTDNIQYVAGPNLGRMITLGIRVSLK